MAVTAMKAYRRFLSILVLVCFTCIYISIINEDIVYVADVRGSSSYGLDADDQTHSHGAVRKILTKTIYPITVSAPFKIENPDVCRTVDKISCLVIVHTAPSHTWQRNEMRRTWLNRTHYSPKNIVVIFLLGATVSSDVQEKINVESIRHGDIVQGHFIDSYHNLTHKGVMGYRWITEHCRNAEIVVKIDDDAFIDMFKLFEHFSFLKERKKFIFCNAIKPKSMPIIRKNSSKWFVNNYQFKDHALYPHAYCSGFVVFISTDLIPALYKAAMSSPFFWVDDVYLFGVLPSKIKGVTRETFGGNLTFYHPKALECYKKKMRKCDYLVMPAKNKEIDIMWKAVIADRKQSIYGNYYI